MSDFDKCSREELIQTIQSLEEELLRFRHGFQGGCYACEYVGETNVKLSDELKKCKLLVEAVREMREAQNDISPDSVNLSKQSGRAAKAEDAVDALLAQMEKDDE